jgi:hypothetical protein
MRAILHTLAPFAIAAVTILTAAVLALMVIAIAKVAWFALDAIAAHLRWRRRKARRDHA